MRDTKELQQISRLLREYGQEHLLAFWEQLDAAGQRRLLGELKKLDFDRIDRWVAGLVLKAPTAKISTNLEPAPAYKPEPQDSRQQKLYRKARDLGKTLLSQGKVAAFVVAGGQGTRLGFDGPKGDFPISPIKYKTLFRLFTEYIATATGRYDARLPWYIMTSPLNYQQTKEVLEANGYYGLNKADVFIFEQGTLPNFDLDGKILMAEKATIATSPDGHGGSLKALYESGALADMKKRGVEIMSYWQVDNSLINIFDPLFVGLHAIEGSEMSSKALVKTDPKEKVGNFCLVDGKVTVIEYSDLPDELAQSTNPDGSLLLELGSIAIHLISTSFVEKLNLQGFSLPLHRAVKKIPHIDEHGNLVEPAEPNGIKLETFVFDALPLASKSIILQTIREQEFAPAKNATGIDSAESARQMMIDRAADWLESAGVSVPRRPDGHPDCTLEIASSFALYKEDIADKTDKIPQIKRGDTLYLE